MAVVGGGVGSGVSGLSRAPIPWQEVSVTIKTADKSASRAHALSSRNMRLPICSFISRTPQAAQRFHKMQSGFPFFQRKPLYAMDRA
jgi:hypothetical protein